MALYLANRDTEIILFKPIKVKLNTSLSLYKPLKKSVATVQRSMFVCFVALRPKSTAMVIAGRSVHLRSLPTPGRFFFPKNRFFSFFDIL